MAFGFVLVLEAITTPVALVLLLVGVTAGAKDKIRIREQSSSLIGSDYDQKRTYCNSSNVSNFFGFFGQQLQMCISARNLGGATLAAR